MNRLFVLSMLFCFMVAPLMAQDYEDELGLAYGSERAEFSYGEAMQGWMAMSVDFNKYFRPEPVDGVYTQVDMMPQFRGKDATNFARWLFRRYERARQPSTGVFAASFIVEPDGKIGNVEVLRHIGPESTAEMVRLINRSPKWKPGIHKGRPVRVKFVFEMALYGRD